MRTVISLTLMREQLDVEGKFFLVCLAAVVVASTGAERGMKRVVLAWYRLPMWALLVRGMLIVFDHWKFDMVKFEILRELHKGMLDEMGAVTVLGGPTEGL